MDDFIDSVLNTPFMFGYVSYVIVMLLSPAAIALAIAWRASASCSKKIMYIVVSSLVSYGFFYFGTGVIGWLAIEFVTSALFNGIYHQLIQWSVEGYYEKYPPLYWLVSMLDLFVSWWWLLIFLLQPPLGWMTAKFLSKHWLQRPPTVR